ncbi:MAG: SixA phosphatase family protein [Bryobacteraceae bacterium]
MEIERSMQVYLLRHGAAEEDRSGLSDADRALTQDGRRKLRQTLQTASQADVRPTLIFTSALKRAIETAEIAQELLGYKGEVLRTEALLPGSSVEGVWGEIRVHANETAIVLVGHNPLFAELPGYLLGVPELQVDVKKGSLLRIDFESLSSQPQGILRWFLVAKLAAR